MSVRVDGNAMPSLDAFDEEFGREHFDIDLASKSPFRISTVLGLALAAGAISAFALGWPIPSGMLRSESEQASSETPEIAIRRLTQEVDALKQANRELAQVQQQAAETIAALQSGEQERNAAPTFWYSDVRGLTYRNPFQSDVAASATNGQRSANARPRSREAPRREEGGPVSLEPPQ
jgi:hypothetical protein